VTGYPSGEQLAALAAPEAYPEDPSSAAGVERIQTHISHLFLTGERVYKLRKNVDLGFVRFADREERNADCLREVQLNRRLAADVYLGVAPLLLDGGPPRFGAVAETLCRLTGGEVPEHCVVMRRLPAHRDALSLLERGLLGAAQLDRLALAVARFHRRSSLGTPASFEPVAWRTRCTEPLEDSFRLLGELPTQLVSARVLEGARGLARRFVSEHADRFEARRVAGRAVDGHGDLHLQHIWFDRDDAEPVAIDCLEFDEGLRRVDAAAEVAFTAMDLVYRGRRDLAERFLRIYAQERDDFDLYGVVDYFIGYRAAVRAKVAGLAAGDPAIEDAQRAGAAKSARRHLVLCEHALREASPGALVLVGGVVGTGKTSLADALADRLFGVPVASDRVRRELASRRADPDASDRYASEAKARVYAGLLERARPVSTSGRTAILDATWSRRIDRAHARALAAELGARTLFVETRCPPELALQRLARRQAWGRDASDAGPAYHAESVAGFEGFDEATEGERVVVDTGLPDWRDALAVLTEKLAAR
jgi:aminoglycoside phosphotransferase family enzyme/predicted kinase